MDCRESVSEHRMRETQNVSIRCSGTNGSRRHFGCGDFKYVDAHSPGMDDQVGRWNDFYRTQKRPWRGVSRSEVLPFDEGSSVLEIGCGNGKTLAMLLNMGHTVTGVDFSEEAVTTCRSLYPEASVERASVLDLPFGDGVFDGAVAFHVLEHITEGNLSKATSEIVRVVRKGGHIVIRLFSPEDMRSSKGERIDSNTVVRGNGIMYIYHSEESIRDAFSDIEVLAMREIVEKTKFGGERKRMEFVFRR